MRQIEVYGKIWAVDDARGQEGLIREDHYKSLFSEEQQPISFQSGNVWLDLGANIGAFAIRAADFVDTVVAVEPEPNNLERLEQNIHLNGVDNIQIVRMAAVPDNDLRTSVPLAISNTFSSTHRVGHIRGRQEIMVPAIGVNDLVTRYYVNKIKMDIEGGEADILEQMSFAQITEIIFEYHFSMLKDTDWVRFYGIIAKLEETGFKILKQPKQKSKAWHTIVWAKRPFGR